MKILLSGSNRGRRIEWIEKFGGLLRRIYSNFLQRKNLIVEYWMLALKLIFLTRLTLTFLITLRLFPRFSEIFPYIN